MPEKKTSRINCALGGGGAEETKQTMKEALNESGEWLRVTLASIGDAAIARDACGHEPVLFHLDLR